MSVDGLDPARQVRILQIVAGAMLVAIAAYGFVAMVAVDVPQQSATAPPEYFAPILMALAVIAIAAAPLIERLMLSRPSDKPLATYFVARLIGLALREAAAVYGLVAALATREPMWFAAGASVAGASILLAWPRRAALDDYLGSHGAPR